MRITFMMPADNLTGGNRVVATYAKLLRQRGHEVLVVSNAHAQPSLREQCRALRHGQWQAMRQRMNPKPGLIALSGVPHRVLETARVMTCDDLPDADVLIASWWETAVWMQSMPASKGHKVHLIQGFETWNDNELSERVHDALRLPNCKIAISTGLKRDIETELGDLGISVVPNAVDLAQFDAPERPSNQAPTVGFIYSLTAIKGVDRCLRAIELAREQIPELQTVSFGAVQPVAELPLPADTSFVYRPQQDQLAGLYARCDMWLFSSRQESFGLPILEAMACRTPVIGVPIGAAPELLDDGAGILLAAQAEDETVQAMAAAIVSLCRMPAAQWQAISDRAYRKARRCNWDASADLFEAALQRAVQQAS